MKNKLIIILYISMTLLSCQNKSKDKYYYKTGELWYETKLIDKSKQTYHYRVFYKNGYLKEEGTALKDGTYDGFWHEYFSDGRLMWSGYYDKGNIVISKNSDEMPDFVHLPASIEIENKTKVLKIGESYKMRTFVRGIHPSIYHITDENYNNVPVNKEDSDRFPNVITPNRIGKIHIWIVFPNKDGYFIAGDPRLSFEFNVIK